MTTHVLRHEDAIIGLYNCANCGLPFEMWEAVPECKPKEEE